MSVVKWHTVRFKTLDQAKGWCGSMPVEIQEQLVKAVGYHQGGLYDLQEVKTPDKQLQYHFIAQLSNDMKNLDCLMRFDRDTIIISKRFMFAVGKIEAEKLLEGFQVRLMEIPGGSLQLMEAGWELQQVDNEILYRSRITR